MALTTVPASLSATALTLTTAAQPNITSVGTLSALNVGNITSTGNLSLNQDGANIYIGADLDLRILHDGSNGTFRNDTGSLTIDVGGDLTLDAGGNQLNFAVGGTTKGRFEGSSDSFVIRSVVSDGDLIFRGNDGGSSITALTLDMSEAGEATFNAGIKLGDGYAAQFGASQDLLVYHSSNENIIQANTSDQDLLFKGKDGSSTITALTLDMSEAGAAVFNGSISTGSNLSVGTTNTSQFVTILKDHTGYTDIGVSNNTSNSDLYLGVGGSGAGNSDLINAAYVLAGGASSTLVLGTNTDEKMRILTNGNVGIGTNNPEGRLMVEVTGANATPPIKINRGLDGGRIQMQYSGNETGYGEIGQMYAGTGRTQIWVGANLNSFSTGHSSSPVQHDANYASWFSDWDSYRDRFTVSRIASGTTTSLLLIDSSGKVGIGTASPSEELHVTSSDSGNHTRVHITKTSTAGTAGVSLRSKDASNTWTIYSEDASASKLYLYDGAASVMTLDSANNSVGIDTTSPSRKLDVIGASNQGIRLKAGAQIAYTPTSSDFYSGLTLENLSSGHAYSIAYGQGGRLKFSYFDNSSTYEELAHMRPGGDFYPAGSIVMSGGEGINFGSSSPSPNTGASGSNNLLDDYEEGTWTPTLLNGGTIHSTSAATYTKVGRLIHFNLYFTISVPNNGGTFAIGGLPYTPNGGGGNYTGASISYYGSANLQVAQNAIIHASNNYIYIHRADGNAQTVLNSMMYANGWSSSNGFIVSGCFVHA